jgi:hypothetical protein
MRKLKLESLQVESFETTAPDRASRGTVDGHVAPAPDTKHCDDSGPSYCNVCYESQDTLCEPATYDVVVCTDTNYFDCTFGCTQQNTCGYRKCWIGDDTKRCNPG